MGRLVPADELLNAFLDAHGGPIAQLAFGAAQVGGRQPHVARLVAVALNADLAPRGPSDQVDQPVEPHALPAADVDGLGHAPPAPPPPPPPRPRPPRPPHPP